MTAPYPQPPPTSSLIDPGEGIVDCDREGSAALVERTGQNPVFPDSGPSATDGGATTSEHHSLSDTNARGGDPLGSPPRDPDTGLAALPVSRTDSGVGRGYRVVTSSAEEIAQAKAFYDAWFANETRDQKAYAKGRSVVFSLMQYRVHPDTGQVLMTQEQWNRLLSELEKAGVLDRHAAIWHDLDVLPDGTPKALHFHGVVRLVPGAEKQLRYLSIRSGVPASRWRKPRDSYAEGKVVTGPLAADIAFYDMCQYLVHEDERSRDEQKHLYSRDEARANFDFGAFLDAGRPAPAKRAWAPKVTDVDRLVLKVQEEGVSIREARRLDPLSFSRAKSRVQSARQTYLGGLEPPSVRVNYYLSGASETGKTSLARLFARTLHPDLSAEECYFEVGSEMVAFQAYDGQPVVIWDDYRAVSLLAALKDRGTVWRVFDTSPGRAQVNVKHGAVGMVQAVNIVTGVAPYRDFLDGLAGSFKSADGTEHVAEDPVQSWRRFPFVGEVTAEQVLLYANRGFAGTGEYRQYEHIVTMQANMRTLMRTLDGIAEVEEREQFRRELGASFSVRWWPPTIRRDRPARSPLTMRGAPWLDTSRSTPAMRSMSATQSRLSSVMSRPTSRLKRPSPSVSKPPSPFWTRGTETTQTQSPKGTVLSRLGNPVRGASALNSNPERNPS